MFVRLITETRFSFESKIQKSPETVPKNQLTGPGNTGGWLYGVNWREIAEEVSRMDVVKRARYF